MSDPNPSPEAFRQMASEYIEVANRQGQDAYVGAVATAMLHAGARYAAFVAASNSPNKTQMQLSRKTNLDQITAQFRTYLEGHYDEHSENYDSYIKR
ncbi:DUF3144 domain-containing protein [Asticcacaulis sp. YBE204]|uniref:DUF3144 domain-containing protein n=1 Tax=Asticcacaulis sp. YBE204 TaxID=1282363 RepID=UPI0003C3C621|nr:DUF3144 domain-containing protein [Asticcacaulis sp. YBE204]ESQ77803.1 hypothetical protein AEYBE204_16875 [Asticcacaulis sp. YBE204]